MNELHPETGRVTEQKLIQGRYLIPLVTAFMFMAGWGVYLAEQVKLKRYESDYKSLLNQKDVATKEQQFVQSHLTEVTWERDEALTYINSLQSKLTEVTKERNASRDYELSQQGRLDVNR